MIRKYSTTDKLKVIGLLKKNIPQYFDPSEEADYKDYLENELEDYFVYEQNHEIIGAGGINYFPKEKLARISWDMIDPASHGKGIGKELVQFRIHHIKQHTNIETIIVRTSQVVYKFYERMGFELVKVEKDYWAKNFDLYLMKMNNK